MLQGHLGFFVSNTSLQGSYWLQNTVTMHFIWWIKTHSPHLQSDPIRSKQAAQQTTGSAATVREDLQKSPRLLYETKGARVSFAVVGVTLLNPKIVKEPSLTIPWEAHNLLQQNIPIYLQISAKWLASTFSWESDNHTEKKKKKEWLKGQSEEGAKKQTPSEKLYMTGNSRRKAPSNRMNEKRKMTVGISCTSMEGWLLLVDGKITWGFHIISNGSSIEKNRLGTTRIVKGLRKSSID